LTIGFYLKECYKKVAGRCYSPFLEKGAGGLGHFEVEYLIIWLAKSQDDHLLFKRKRVSMIL
jgi:hypothetical protein